MRKKAVQQGRSERRGESCSVPYVEPLSDARTPLAGFFRILLGNGCSRHRFSMVDIHLFKILPSRGERRSAVSYELHESPEIIDRQVELFETGCQPLQLFRRGALVRVRKRFQYFCGPSACAKSFKNRCGFLAVFSGKGLVRKILHGAVRALRKSGLELDHGLNDTIGFPAAFRWKNLGLFERRENCHSRSDMRRGTLWSLQGDGRSLA